MLKIAICDDEAAAVSVGKNILKEDLAARGLSAEITGYTDAETLEDVIKAGSHYDLLLLDIDMPGKDGIELGTELHELLQDTLLIYVSGRPERVFDSFKARPFRFIRKPMLEQEWPIVWQDVEKELKRRQASFFVFTSKTNQIRMKSEAIVYVEALRKKEILHTEKEEYELNDGFESVAAELEGFGFIRIHRSYIVNYRFIHSINRTDVELDDGTILPIGRSKHQAVSQEFHRLVQRELSKA